MAQSKTNKTAADLNFEAAKADIKDCWENPINGAADRFSGNWIYQVDMATMVFCKTVRDFMPNNGELSLYDVFCAVMKAKTLNKLMGY